MAGTAGLLARYSPQQAGLAQQLARELTDPAYIGQAQQQGCAEQNHLLLADPRLAEYLSAAGRAAVLEQLANRREPPGTTDKDRLNVTMGQMERVLRALEDLRRTVLPRDPQLFATMAEAPLDDLTRLRQEVHEYLEPTTPS